jgi:hypothetical protein
MGRMQREKGKRGERECAAELRELLGPGVSARRGVQYQGGPDSPDVVTNIQLHIECKRVESLQLYPALAQAEADAPHGTVPVVWHRRNGRPSVVIVATSRLLELANIISAAAAQKPVENQCETHADSEKPG